MRIVLIADIHGNLPALDAVLAEIAAEHVDQIVCLGDVAATGPQPRAVVQRLRELGCSVVMGNADITLLDPPQPSASDETTRRIEEISAWGATQLSREDKDYIRTFQPTIAVVICEPFSEPLRNSLQEIRQSCRTCCIWLQTEFRGVASSS